MSLLKSTHDDNARGATELLGIPPEQLLDFSVNTNPLGMPASLKRATVDNLDCAEHYPDVGYAKLHAALAEHHQISTLWILARDNETESVFALVQDLKPHHVMIMTPGFAEYRRALQWRDCTIHEFALREDDGWQLTDAVIDALIPELDCLFPCTPNNPTDLLPDDHLLRGTSTHCELPEINLVLGKAFIDFIIGEPRSIPLLHDNPHIWMLHSLTKFYAIPGLRLEYLVNSNEQAVTQIRHRQMPWSINAFAALAGEIILHDDTYQQAAWKWLEQEGAGFDRQLKELPGLAVYPSRANYRLLRCERAGFGLRRTILEQHILIRGYANYPRLDTRYYRVTARNQEGNSRLLAALCEVLNGTALAD